MSPLKTNWQNTQIVYDTDLNAIATQVNTNTDELATVYKPGGADVAVADGGTGASTAEVARTNLGAGTSNLALGTTAGTAKAGNYQPAWTDITSKPAVIAAGADEAAARAAIGVWLTQFNVYDYGAVGNGTTDDTAAIQAAINAATAAGGGQVFLPIGTYKLDATITLKSGVELVGAGSRSVLKPNFPTTVPNRVIDNDWATGSVDMALRNFKIDRSGAVLSHGILLNAVNGLLIDGIEIVGDSANNSGAIAISGIGPTTDLLSRNIRVVNCSFEGAANFSVQVGFVENCVISNNTAHESEREVFGVEPEGASSTAKNVTISGNNIFGTSTIIGSNTGLIIVTETSGGTIDGVAVTGNVLCQPDGATETNPGINIIGGSSISVVGNVIRNMCGAGIAVGIDGYVTDGVVISDNSVINCGLAGGLPGIRLRDSTHNIVTGNYVHGASHTFSVGEELGAADNFIAFNYLRDSAPTSAAAAGTVIIGNKPDAGGIDIAAIIDTDSRDALTTGESTLLRRAVNSTTVTSTNGTLRLTYFTARKTETVTQIRTMTGSTAQVAATLCRAGIYSVAANDDLTLVASTPNNTTLWLAANTRYNTNLSASFVKTRGVRYAVGLLVVGASTPPTFVGQTGILSTECFEAPVIGASLTSQTDLPASITAASLAGSSTQSYTVLLP